MRYLNLIALVAIVLPYFVAASPTRRIGFTPARQPATSLNNVYRARQATRKSIMKRAKRKALLPKRKLLARQAEASPKPYPTCKTGRSDGTGYAVFDNYNIQGYAVTSPSIYTGSKNVLQCELQCEAIDECEGVYYDGSGLCYLKTSSLLQGTMVYNESPANAALAIEGSCAELSNYFDANIMLACCDNPPPPTSYPVCSPTYSSGTKSGYAVFPMFDLLAGDVTGGVGGETLTQCLARCRSYGANNANGDTTASCIGYTYRGGNCYQKALDITKGTFTFHQEEGLVTYIAGGCQGVSSFATPEAMAACCNDL